MQDGTCASQGYTVKGRTTTEKYPVISNIIITAYSKPSIDVQDTCSPYAINCDSSGQSYLTSSTPKLIINRACCNPHDYMS